jgi:hypothetical protein
MFDVEQQSSALTRARGFVYFVCFVKFVYNGFGGSLAQRRQRSLPPLCQAYRTIIPPKKDLGEDDV